jgi:hypothetical protein
MGSLAGRRDLIIAIAGNIACVDAGIHVVD